MACAGQFIDLAYVLRKGDYWAASLPSRTRCIDFLQYQNKHNVRHVSVEHIDACIRRACGAKWLRADRVAIWRYEGIHINGSNCRIHTRTYMLSACSRLGLNPLLPPPLHRSENRSLSFPLHSTTIKPEACTAKGAPDSDRGIPEVLPTAVISFKYVEMLFLSVVITSNALL